LISPVTLFDMADQHRGPPQFAILGYTIVRLDPAIVRGTMLAALTNRHFHGADSEVDYRVAIVHRDDVKQVVWESEPGVAASIVASPDVKQGLMGPRPEQMFLFARNLLGELPAPPPAPADPTKKIEVRGDKIVVSMVERGGPRGADGGGRVITRAGQFGTFDGRWMLMAKHRAGSLEAAVAAVRMRNLMISSSVLLLLTIAVGLIVVSARRAQKLARQQMEFVAAVSHELRTPVSVIGAAAGNLADGVVGDPQRVRKYGETIQGEARRLAETVERVLQLAGIAAGRAAAAQAPVNPADLIEASLAACRTEIDKAGFTVETSVADGLPNVGGDVTALESALQNLISNAVKYGGQARWLRISASLDPGIGARQQVLYPFEDRALGNAAEDRKHIFEPFYRGREAVSQQIQGSGLGLNLVMRIAEAHDGKVTVSSEPGKGSTFTLSLPAVHDRPAATRESINLVREATPTR
jgi:signal transduction histidine kinase